jgi:hypothetical protein
MKRLAAKNLSSYPLPEKIGMFQKREMEKIEGKISVGWVTP